MRELLSSATWAAHVQGGDVDGPENDGQTCTGYITYVLKCLRILHMLAPSQVVQVVHDAPAILPVVLNHCARSRHVPIAEAA